MRIKKFRKFVADFETTVYSGQDFTEVWAAAIVEFYTEHVEIHHSIGEFFSYVFSIPGNKMVYFNNLKFDGSFIIDWLLRNKLFKEAFEGEDIDHGAFLSDKDMPYNSFKYSISDRGNWYTIIVRTRSGYTEIRDSLKLLPFSVESMGGVFSSREKLEMKYEGFRYAGCEITEEEKKYIENDVLIVKDALEFMEREGHTKLTIGSCCMDEFVKMWDTDLYESMFPDLTQVECPIEGFLHADHYIRKSYKGGWCYVKNDRMGVIQHNGVTFDVNSLYPSMMHSCSGNIFPIGLPKWFYGRIPDLDGKWYCVRVKVRFKLKEDRLPTVQIKGSFLYKGTEWLETSDIPGCSEDPVVLTLTCTDYKLLHDHYTILYEEILDGCWFGTAGRIFDQYIDKYMEIKMRSKGVEREEAKLFLNNLYGKLGANNCSSFKRAYLNERGEVKFVTIEAYDKKPGYIPIGSAITSYSRNFTIRAAQLNYKTFCYADTDSIHLAMTDNAAGITVHESKLCCWKLEKTWEHGIFARQKTYIETSYDGEITVKCAGMNKAAKENLIASLTETPIKDRSESEEEFIKQKRTLEDFKRGLEVPGKLTPKRIKGGIVLQNTTFKLH